MARLPDERPKLLDLPHGFDLDLMPHWASRFFAKAVLAESGCWEWTGSQSDGYGKFVVAHGDSPTYCEFIGEQLLAHLEAVAA